MREDVSACCVGGAAISVVWCVFDDIDEVLDECFGAFFVELGFNLAAGEVEALVLVFEGAGVWDRDDGVDGVAQLDWEGEKRHVW